NQINISTEGILIDGKKVHITGQTTIDNAVIKDAMIQSISASKIVADTLSAISADLGTVYVNGDAQEFLYTNAIDTNPKTSGTHIYIRPTADGEVRATKTKTTDQYVPIRADSFVAAPTDNAYIVTDNELRVMNISKTGIYRGVRAANFYGTGFITTSTNAYVGSDSEVRLVNKGYVDGSTGNPIYRDLRANILWADGLSTNAGTNLYLGSDDEIRMTARSLYNNGSPIYRNVRANGYFGQFMTADPNLYAYIGTDLELRVTSRGLTTGVYRTVRAKDFVTDTSQREKKKDISIYDENTLDVWRNSNIYTYHRLTDEANSKLQLGMMLDEIPEITHSETGDSFALYALTSFVGKGVKDLVAVTDNHTEAINILREQNENLILKIASLEMEIADIKKKLEVS
ncbi:tail fiber domain-containing protein, partial [Heyndrickxia camelliae]